MQEITIYCSARDQTARVLVDHDPLREGEPSLLESTFYCLEIGHGCSGACCTLGAEPPHTFEDPHAFHPPLSPPTPAGGAS